MACARVAGEHIGAKTHAVQPSREGIIPSGAGSHAEPYYAPRLLDDLHLPKLDIPHSTGGGENLMPNLDLKTQEGYLPPLGNT